MMLNGDKNERKMQIASDSYNVGYWFGSLIGRNNPDWTLEHIQLFISRLRPKLPLLGSHYKKGFYDGFEKARKYKNLSVNALTLEEGEQDNGFTS